MVDLDMEVIGIFMTLISVMVFTIHGLLDHTMEDGDLAVTAGVDGEGHFTILITTLLVDTILSIMD
jgi:hypothetical protein